MSKNNIIASVIAICMAYVVLSIRVMVVQNGTIKDLRDDNNSIRSKILYYQESEYKYRRALAIADALYNNPSDKKLYSDYKALYDELNPTSSISLIDSLIVNTDSD